MAATISNWTMYRGENKTVTLTSPVTATGFALRFRLFVYGQPDSVLIEKTTAGGGVTVSGTTISVILTPDDTDFLFLGTYSYSVERTDVGYVMVLNTGLGTIQ